MGIGLGSLLGSAFNPINLASLAMGPAGWANLAIRTIGPQLAMNAIQVIGQRMGLPQPVIDMAQASFASRAGFAGLERLNVNQAVRGFASEAGLNPADTGRLMRSAEGQFDKLMDLINDGLRRSDRNSNVNRQGGKSLLVAIALALGEVMDKKLDKMYDLSVKLGNLETKDSQYGATTAELQATGKELDFVGQALNNSLKSIGEAASTVARKN